MVNSINGQYPGDDIARRYTSNIPPPPQSNDGGDDDGPHCLFFALVMLAGLSVSALGLAGFADLLWRWTT